MDEEEFEEEEFEEEEFKDEEFEEGEFEEEQFEEEEEEKTPHQCLRGCVLVRRDTGCTEVQCAVSIVLYTRCTVK